jgi:hypothetical protein
MREGMVEVERQIAENKALIQKLLEESDLLDDDGYPTDDALTIISKWHWDDIKGWFDFIHGLWYLSSWGWREGLKPDDWNKGEEVYTYEISTAGWSGNESLIYAMQENTMLWCITWVQSRRGGHYIFEGKELK